VQIVGPRKATTLVADACRWQWLTAAVVHIIHIDEVHIHIHIADIRREIGK
jgi:hypothetical protein